MLLVQVVILYAISWHLRKRWIEPMAKSQWTAIRNMNLVTTMVGGWLSQIFTAWFAWRMISQFTWTSLWRIESLPLLSPEAKFFCLGYAARHVADLLLLDLSHQASLVSVLCRVC